MPESARITDVINRLERIEDKVDKLKEAEAARRGGLRVFIGMFSVLGTIAGWAGSYMHEIWSKTS